MSILITNIKTLVKTEDKPVLLRAGKAMQNLANIDNAWLYIEGEKIHSFGSMESLNHKNIKPTTL